VGVNLRRDRRNAFTVRAAARTQPLPERKIKGLRARTHGGLSGVAGASADQRRAR